MDYRHMVEFDLEDVEQIRGRSVNKNPDYETWRKGNTADSIVSNVPRGGSGSWHSIEYYGGYVVAESMSERTMRLVLAVPEMVEVLDRVVKVCRLNIGENGPATAKDRLSVGNDAVKVLFKALKPDEI